MTLPAQVDVNTARKVLEFDGFYSNCQCRDEVLKLFLRNAQANNMSFTILELKDIDSIQALYGLAVNFLEMFRVYIELCGSDVLNPRKVSPMLATGEKPYTDMWAKIIATSKILTERHNQSGDFKPKIQLVILQDSEKVIFWISRGMKVAQKITPTVKK